MFSLIRHVAWHLPGVVVGVQEMVGFLAHWFAEIESVEIENVRIFVTEADVHVAVDLPEGGAAVDVEIDAVEDWLTAAANAAAWAGHDFDEIVAGFAALDGVEQLARVAKPADDGNLDAAGARDLEGGFAAFAKLYVAHFFKIVGVWIEAGDHVVGGAQCGIHNAAGGAENGGSAGGGAERMVEVGVWNFVNENVVGADHAGEFAGGEHDVDIGIAAGVTHWFEGTFFFFGETWHDGDHADLVRIGADGLRKVAFADGAEHLLWALGGGEVVGHFREVGFQETDPAWTAGGEHWPLVLITMGEALDKFAGFFHDGEIGGKVGVENVVEADLLEHADHFWCGENVAVDAELFGPGDAHGRSNLHDGDGVWIGEGVENFFGVVAFMERGGWTMGHALAAEGAVGFADGAVVADVDGDAGTGAGDVPDVEALDLVADLDATHAFDALGGVTDERGGEIPVKRFDVFWKRIGEHALLKSDALQLTVAVAHTGWAVAVVL